MRTHNHTARLTLIAALSTLLAACGGGGGGDAAPPPAAGANLGVTFVAQPTPNTSTGYGATNSELTYTVALANTGTVGATGAVVTAKAAGATLEAVACDTPAGGAACPAGLTLASLASGAPFTLPGGSSLRLTLTGVATAATGAAVGLTVSAAVPAGVTDTDASNNSRTASFTVIAPLPATLVTSVPAPVYTDASKVAAFNYLNGVRSRCGFGQLKQDTRLDQAADDHQSYIYLNGPTWPAGVDLHTQVAGRPGFTGVTGTDRAAYRGYAGSAGEVLGTSSPPNSLIAQFSWIMTAYHGMHLLNGFRDLGLGSHLTDPNGLGFVSNYEGANPGLQTGATPQEPASGTVAVYPCEGETSYYRQHGGETPNPIPGADLEQYGAAVLARTRTGSALRIDAWTIAPRGGAVLAATRLTSANDPNQRLAANEAVLIPNSVLGVSQVYDVVLRGAVDGVRFERAWSFTSGTCDRRAMTPATCPWVYTPGWGS